MKVFDYLLPKPVTVIPQPGALRITPAFTVGLKGAPGKRTCAGVSLPRPFGGAHRPLFS